MGSAEGLRYSKPRLHIGRYQVVHPLGQGAMGEVLLAYDPVLDRNVAIKYLRRDLDLIEEHRAALIARLWQEARASARVSHPNIVALHDMGEDDDLGPYLVFEHVEGPTLKERLARGALEPGQAAQLAREMGDALAAAHAASVVHRDVKPENVILRRTGCKIADFGIARLPNSTLTQRGSLLGTPAYSAPETLEGAQFSPRSDQFSLAATLYEALFGRRAFPGDDALQVANRVRLDEPRRLAAEFGLDLEVDQVLTRALAKKPEGRFDTCAQFGAALSVALEQSPQKQAHRGLLGQLDTMSAVSSETYPRREFNVWPPLVGVGMAAVGLYLLFNTAAQSPTVASGSPRPREEAVPAQTSTEPLPAEAARSSWVEAKQEPTPAPAAVRAISAKPTLVPSPARALQPRSRATRVAGSKRTANTSAARTLR